MELSERHIQKLEEEGFTSVYEVFDEPNEVYPPHSHKAKNAIIIIEGSMGVTMKGESKIYTMGNRVDIPANTEHSVVIGTDGCKYVIGE